VSISTQRCGDCGRPMDGPPSDLAGGAWDVVICAPCARRRLLADGGAALNLNDQPHEDLFDLGEIQIRPGAVHILSQAGDHYWQYLARHSRGDSGEFAYRDDNHEPRAAFLAGQGNIISQYRTTLGDRIWIMTTPGKMTSVMAPGEY